MTAYILCAICHSLRGGPIGNVGAVEVHQLCRCATADEHAAQPRIGDHNTKLELCRCCGVEALPSGSRWSVWFCDECKARVIALNRRCGRSVVPIGRHSLMNGVFLDPAAADDGVRVFADEVKTLFSEMGGTERWVKAAVRLNLAAAGLPTSDDIELDTFLAAVAALPSVKEQRFTQMLDSLSRPAHPPGTEPVKRPLSAEHCTEGDRR